jgi:hypothetical protein
MKLDPWVKMQCLAVPLAGNGSAMSLWMYPDERYSYPWYSDPPVGPTDGDIKHQIVERLREEPLTRDSSIRVDVKQHVVILGGSVPSTLAKRVAGDDAWDTPGVVDVSNQLQVQQTAAAT